MAKKKNFNKNRLKHNQSIKNKWNMIENSNEALERIEDKHTDMGIDRIKKQSLFSGSRVKLVKNAQAEKMSEVLLDFAEPLLSVIDQGDDHAYEKAIQLSVVLWNFAIVQESKDKKYKELVDSISTNFKTREEKQILKDMLARKISLYPDNRRYIMSYDLSFYGDTSHLTVASTIQE